VRSVREPARLRYEEEVAMRSLWISLVLAAPAVAMAQGNADTEARARKLFDEGAALREIDLNAACVKFSESLALTPHAVGTMLNVALCDEKLGHFATAVEKFTLARDLAIELIANGEKDAEAHKKAATAHIAELSPRVPHVTIELVPPVLPDAKIVIDDKAYPLDKLTELPIDPGKHEVAVSAPGYLPYETTFAIAEGEHHSVAIPHLEKSVTVRSSRRTIGIVVGGAGAIVGVTGLVVGLVANSRYDDVTSCHADGNCDLPEDYTRRKSARSLGNVGTVVGIAGGAAIVVGAVLWYTGRKSSAEQAPRVTLLPQLAPDAAGIAAVGRF
jgi:hypothetical protein